MLNRSASNHHGFRICFQPFSHGVDDMLVLPSPHTTLFTRGTMRFECATDAFVREVHINVFIAILTHEPKWQRLACRASIGILIGQILEILLVEPAGSSGI